MHGEVDREQAARLSLVKWKAEEDEPLTGTALRQRMQTHAAASSTLADDWTTRDEPVSFKDFEQAIRLVVFSFARIAIMLFLALREEQLIRAYPSQVEREGRRFRRAPAIPRSLTILFGVVHYARTYMREVGHHGRRGFHPLDVALGLVGDWFSWNLLTMAARLATKLSFAEARATLASFVPDAPSTEVIENTVLGLGRHTAAWFEHAPAPEGDGEVLVIMFDGKGAPTATESELSRRRGKRRRRQRPASPRHRGRHHRRRYGKKPRRKKGDKSKNARIVTMAVMFTLKPQGNKLLGPINRKLRSPSPGARRPSAGSAPVPASSSRSSLTVTRPRDLRHRVLPRGDARMDVMHVINGSRTVSHPEASSDVDLTGRDEH